MVSKVSHLCRSFRIFADTNDRYKSIIPKARLISLSAPFLSYLRADGIRLPPDPAPAEDSWDDDSSVDGTDELEAVKSDPFAEWASIHTKIQETIAELKGSVFPKLNWSAPKDATWMVAGNSMECRTANDVYLLLKSSDFVTHDLEQVFDGCVDEDESEEEREQESQGGNTLEPPKHARSKEEELSRIKYHLVLRQTIPALNPALEFRCFVRERELLCICQRDLNYFSFLPALAPNLNSKIRDFFHDHLRRSFPDESFAFDVYIPQPYVRVWLIDINPWAPRTDPLLFSWLEILTITGPGPGKSFGDMERNVVRLSLNCDRNSSLSNRPEHTSNGHYSEEDLEDIDDVDADTEEEEDIFIPEFRLVNKDDPEAYNFNTPQYSAHKMPKDVVDASADGEAGLREFMGTWREISAKQEREYKEERDAEM